MSRFPDDRYDIPLEDDAAAFDDEDEDGLPEDARVPVLDDVVLPGPGLDAPVRAPAPAEIDPEVAERLHALVREAVDLALDDALDVLRDELHACLRQHLDARLPQLLDAALREDDGKD